MSASRDVPRVFAAIERYGVLVEHDATLPSLSGIVAGEPVRGSWWAHPRSHDIYNVTHPMREHPSVAVARLISGKLTYVHRRLWPALYGIATSREPWQLDGLARAALALLERVTAEGALRTDDVPWTGERRKDSPGETARELERRLLAHGEEVHTERGAHAKQLETWQRWAKRTGLRGPKMRPAAARATFEEVVGALNAEFGAKGRLPWM
ncbi:MAG: hypothetical protein WEE64_04615 [Dehalococcoidia bacterium]